MITPKPVALIFTIIVLLFCQLAQAQLKADFTVDKPGGCSPLTVQFTNTTTGATASTTYQWSLGNGNTSALSNPGATYYTEKTYSITLTATDGAASSTKTIDVVVYKKPVVDFSVSPANGCVPLSVNFSATATPGDGNITGYVWDYGDGATDKVTTAATSHIYTFGQKPPLALTVTNSYGCYTTLAKNNLVEVFKAVTAVFKASSLTACKPGDEITFTNTSTGSGVLSYEWDFGDGSKSSQQSPKHAWVSKGTYTVTLVVKSSDGCQGTADPVTINVANFSADFSVPAHICQYDQAVLLNKSTAGFTRLEWAVNGNITGSYTNDLYTQFLDTGNVNFSLTATYGTCSVPVVKTVYVNAVPRISDFLATVNGACGVPVTINFSDTSKDAVSWKWKRWGYDQVFGTEKNATYTFTTGGAEQISLTVTNQQGCTSSVLRWVNFDKPYVGIFDKSYNQLNESCQGVVYTFGTWQDSIVQDFKWDFGDGGTSTEREPVHQFNKPGYFTITLTYTTKSGCTGSSTYNVRVLEKIKYDLAVEGSTTVCGNTPTRFNIIPGSGGSVNWYINDTLIYQYYNYQSFITHKFEYDTTYTIKAVVITGQCYDTVIKKNYIKVLPPFPRISNVLNTCEGLRNEVRFTENSTKALTYQWDFGDGTQTNYSSFKDTIRHTYPPVSASYKAVLTTTNGPCTVKDSANVFVMLKQHPVLTLDKTEMCANDVAKFTVTGFERNSWVKWLDGYLDFEYIDILYNDNSRSDIDFVGAGNTSMYFDGPLMYLQTGKKGLRLEYKTTFFNCFDTTTLANIDIHGPVAGFERLPFSGCFNKPVLLRDTSRASPRSPIKEWLWTFGENRIYSRNTGDTFTFNAPAPGEYYTGLRVTDGEGCYSYAPYGNAITLTGPQADFTASNFTVAPQTQVSFTNTSNSYGWYGLNIAKWVFPDGSTSTSFNEAQYKFGNEGEYDVKLVTYNTVSGCTDSISKKITVRKVNSAFTTSLTYINNTSCPPVIAKFTSISKNAVKLAWDFGDGGIAGDQAIVTHTYSEAGIYQVKLYSYDEFNNVDSTVDFITIKGPYALLKVDTLSGCINLQVNLTANVRNAKDFTWDFGDGTLKAGTDSFATHRYVTPGIYRPALILKDAGGCSATSSLPEKVIIDSLSASFSPLPAAACNSATVSFSPAVYSFSKTQLQASLQYRWTINDNPADTILTETGSHYFGQPGQYTVALLVQSPYGCRVQVSKNVDIKQGVKADISGPADICQNSAATFGGSAVPAASNLQWQWKFGSAGTSNLQNPLAQKFTTAGSYRISLVVSNGNCADTATMQTIVHSLPAVSFSQSKPVLCLGDTLNITAAGALSYQWVSNGLIVNTQQATARVFPKVDTRFTIQATDLFGCKSVDSIAIKVVQPITVTVKTPLFACLGNSTQMQASGADSYSWTPVAGLNNASIANPVVNISSTTAYRVVGYDKYNCFTDTANALVTIGALPAVNAGPDQLAIGGTAIALNAATSGDVVSWKWEPADYLSCTNCAAPVSKPQKPVTYTVTVSTAQGCLVKDTVRIDLLCKSDLVYIPTGFTPNGDNLNERFGVLGSGIKAVQHFVIFDRWGKKVFEARNAPAGDRSSSWDGNINGMPAPSGAYVYQLKVECMGGEIFSYQGSVTLIR